MSFDLGRIDITYVDKAGLLVGSWFTALTWGMEVLQLSTYLTSFSHDPIFLRAAVLLLFSADTTWNILFCVSAHRQLIDVVAGSIDSFVPSLTLVCLPFITSSIVSGVNLFLIWRYNKLSKRLWLSICLCILTTVSLACHMWATSLSIKLRSFDMTDLANLEKAHSQALNAGKTGLSLEVALVCLIWLLLLGELLVLLRRDMQGARRVVKRLVLITLESGTVASVVSVATLAYYLSNPTSSNLLVIAVFMPRVYFMTMLFNLNMRKSGGQVMQDAASHSSSSRPSRSGITNSSGLPFSHIGSSAGNSHFGHDVVHISQRRDPKMDEENELEKLPSHALRNPVRGDVENP